MKSLALTAAIFSGIAFSTLSLAEDNDHFKGQEFTDIDQALAVFHEYNKRFENKLKGELKAMDLHEVHELTYTMEDALAHITKSLYTVAEDLETVHLATEYAEPEKVKTFGEKYLAASRQIIR